MGLHSIVRTVAAAGGSLVLVLSLGAVPTQARPAPAADDAGGTPVVVGLNNPRQLSFAPGGHLYVAESGHHTEDAHPCVDSEEFGLRCLNASGSVTRLSRTGSQQRVLTGLPALVSPDEAIGPTDVVLHGQRAYVTLGLGGDVGTRAQFGPGARMLGTLSGFPLAGQGRSPQVIADLAAHEENDPDGAGADSNPVDVVRDRNGWLVTDAGGNTVVRADHRDTRTVAVIPGGTAPAPPFLGLPEGTEIPRQSVPTATAKGPDGAWYVAELTGFPFPADEATIWRLGPDGTPAPWATGLTNVTDLAWGDGELYVVQISDAGLLSGDLTGSLVRVDPGGAHETVGGPWFAPYGVAVRGGAAYVTTCSVCEGVGEVVRVSLP